MEKHYLKKIVKVRMFLPIKFKINLKQMNKLLQKNKYNKRSRKPLHNSNKNRLKNLTKRKLQKLKQKIKKRMNETQFSNY